MDVRKDFVYPKIEDEVLSQRVYVTLFLLWILEIFHELISLLYRRTINDAISWNLMALQHLFQFIECLISFYFFFFFSDFFVDCTTCRVNRIVNN